MLNGEQNEEELNEVEKKIEFLKKWS